MSYIYNKYCHVCCKDTQFYNDYCQQCIKREKDSKYKAHFQTLDNLTLEERIRRLELNEYNDTRENTLSWLGRIY